MNEEVRIPVYLVTGFLESGKTSFLNFTIAEDYFQIEEPTLLIVTEEGIESYDKEELKKYNTYLEVLEEKEELTPEKLVEFEKKYNPDRVIFEYNPFWGVADFENLAWPDGWGIVQEIVMVDASCFQIYMQNMKSMFIEMATNADMITFNRCTPDLPLANFRRSIKVVNPGCEVLFEDENREITDIFEDSVPYDLTADVVKIEDEDYGIFYVDAGEEEEKYTGKIVSFKGKVLKSKDKQAKYFVAGRKAMTCCADDTAFIGYICYWDEAPALKMGSWVTVEAEVKYEYCKMYGDEGPVLYVRKVEAAEKPVNEMVYFT